VYRTDVSISSFFYPVTVHTKMEEKIKKDNSQAIILFIERRIFYRHWKMCAVQLTVEIKLYKWL